MARDGGAVAARPVSRSKHLIGTAAALLALWFGLTAPSVSPVAGPAMPAAPAAPAAIVQDQGGLTGDGTAVVDDAGRAGRGRR